MLEIGDVLGQAAHGGHDECPGQLRGCHGRTHALGNGDAALGAGGDVNVRAYPPRLRDEPEPWQLVHQLPRDLCAVTDQDDDVRIPQAYRQLPQAFDGVGIDLRGVGVEPLCAVELAHRILVIVEYYDVHFLQ